MSGGDDDYGGDHHHHHHHHQLSPTLHDRDTEYAEIGITSRQSLAPLCMQEPLRGRVVVDMPLTTPNHILNNAFTCLVMAA